MKLRFNPFQDIKQKIYGVVKQGISPNKLSLAIILGFALSIIPVLGINTILCFFLAVRLRLNVVVVQAINYLMFPVQLILILPFIKLGQYFFGFFQGVSAMQLLHTIKEGRFMDSIRYIVEVHLVALSAWALIMLPLSLVGYIILLKVLTRRETSKCQVRPSAIE